MGSQLSKDFDIGDQTGSAGPGLGWKLHPATKKGTGEEVTVWLFHKEDAKKMPKKKDSVLVDRLKAGPKHLAKLVHPHLLRVIVPLKEDRKTLAFVTEPVVCSLANALKDCRNIDRVPDSVQNYHLSAQELKSGLQHLGEGIEFVHGEAKMIHRNICPESVLITPSMVWKLGGFEHSCAFDDMNPTAGDSGGKKSKSNGGRPVFSASDYDDFAEKAHPFPLLPLLEYCAPEHVDDEPRYDQSVDTFSFGVLVHKIFNPGNGIIQHADVASIAAYRQRIDAMSRGIIAMGEVPDTLREVVTGMVSTAPIQRPDISEFLKTKYFNDVLTRVARYLDTIVKKTPESKVNFFKALPQVLDKFDEKVVRVKVLPVLIEELKNEDVIEHVLPNVFALSRRAGAPAREFSDTIWPSIVPIIDVTGPPGAIIVLCREIPYMIDQLPAEAVREHIITLISNALRSKHPPIIDATLVHIAATAGRIDYLQAKNVVLPRLQTVSLFHPRSDLKAKSLIAISRMCQAKVFDKETIAEQVVPQLEKCVRNDESAPVVMCVVGVYSALAKLIPAAVTASQVIPFVVPLSIRARLSAEQHVIFGKVLREMIEIVIATRQAELGGAQGSTSGPGAVSASGSLGGAGSADSAAAMMKAFEVGMGGGGRKTNTDVDDDDDWSNIGKELAESAAANGGSSAAGGSSGAGAGAGPIDLTGAGGIAPKKTDEQLFDEFSGMLKANPPSSSLSSSQPADSNAGSSTKAAGGASDGWDALDWGVDLTPQDNANESATNSTSYVAPAVPLSNSASILDSNGTGTGGANTNNNGSNVSVPAIPPPNNASSSASTSSVSATSASSASASASASSPFDFIGSASTPAATVGATANTTAATTTGGSNDPFADLAMASTSKNSVNNNINSNNGGGGNANDMNLFNDLVVKNNDSNSNNNIIDNNVKNSNSNNADPLSLDNLLMGSASTNSGQQQQQQQQQQPVYQPPQLI